MQVALTNLKETRNEKEELGTALEMTENIFDEQIEKFKETIKRLQDEN
jgi:hypothetical protein